jgi:hypothetical protein
MTAGGGGGGGPSLAGGRVSGPSDVPNFGRVNPKSCMWFNCELPSLPAADRILLATADADPLGVDVNVTFDRVGGLDNREL